MGIRTDLTSLGAIGLGTAVAVVGTGALLFAGVTHHADASYCVDVPTVAAITAVPAAPAAPAALAEVTVDIAADAPTVIELSDALVAIETAQAAIDANVNVVVSDRIAVRSGCAADYDERIADVRVLALEQAEVARARAGAARELADEMRAIAAAIRAEAQANGEVDAERIQELVEAALAEAGIRRGGSWGN